MQKFIAAIEVDRRKEDRLDQLNRLTRQLREANAKYEKAFDQGAAMVIRAIRRGASLEEISEKIRWDLVDPPLARAPTMEFDTGDTERIAIPLEFDDSSEQTEPAIEIPFMAEGTK